MRHAAWLNAGQTGKTKAGQERKPSRLADLQAQDIEPERPPLDAPYLIDYLFDAGPVLSGGMGLVALTHADLRAWQDNTGVVLTPWQTRTLRRLSGDYASSLQAAEEPDCPSPWQPEIEELDRAEVSKKVQNAFRTLMQTRPKK